MWLNTIQTIQSHVIFVVYVLGLIRIYLDLPRNEENGRNKRFNPLNEWSIIEGIRDLMHWMNGEDGMRITTKRFKGMRE